jgi:hypothetical protein
MEATLTHVFNERYYSPVFRFLIPCVGALISLGLVGCASPKENKAPKPRPSAGFPLNHVFLPVSSNTLAAIKRSDFIAKEFSHLRVASSTNSVGMQWTGLYLSGEATYLELLQSDAPVFARLASREGISLGTDTRFDFGKMGRDLSVRTGLRITNNTAFRAEANGNRPWFEELKPISTGLRLPVAMYLMQYDAGYLTCDCHKGRVDRAGYLFHKRIDPKIGAVKPLLEDIVEIECRLTPEQASIAERWLRGLGYRSNSKSAFGRYSTEGFSIYVAPYNEGKIGIAKIVCALASRQKATRLQFGADCEVLVEGKRATWIFR